MRTVGRTLASGADYLFQRRANKISEPGGQAGASRLNPRKIESASLGPSKLQRTEVSKPVDRKLKSRRERGMLFSGPSTSRARFTYSEKSGDSTRWVHQMRLAVFSLCIISPKEPVGSGRSSNSGSLGHVCIQCFKLSLHTEKSCALLATRISIRIRLLYPAALPHPCLSIRRMPAA